MSGPGGCGGLAFLDATTVGWAGVTGAGIAVSDMTAVGDAATNGRGVVGGRSITASPASGTTILGLVASSGSLVLLTATTATASTPDTPSTAQLSLRLT
jgi:hypothetical protein